jgi:hypothetical protein
VSTGIEPVRSSQSAPRFDGVADVDRERDGGDVIGDVRPQERDGVGDVAGLDPGHAGRTFSLEGLARSGNRTERWDQIREGTPSAKLRDSSRSNHCSRHSLYRVGA